MNIHYKGVNDSFFVYPTQKQIVYVLCGGTGRSKEACSNDQDAARCVGCWVPRRGDGRRLLLEFEGEALVAGFKGCSLPLSSIARFRSYVGRRCG